MEKVHVRNHFCYFIEMTFFSRIKRKVSKFIISGCNKLIIFFIIEVFKTGRNAQTVVFA